MTAVRVIAIELGIPGYGNNGLNVYDVLTVAQMCFVPVQVLLQACDVPLQVHDCDAVAVTAVRSDASFVAAVAMPLVSEDELTLFDPYCAPTSAALIKVTLA